jgi:HAD superfamily hydrolase (TIGR01484 family)
MGPGAKAALPCDEAQGVSPAGADGRMRPLTDWPVAARAGIRFVFTDIDDTLTLAGRLPAEAYSAMERLERAGLHVVPITGRPAGWCDHIARMWPVAGVVGENGAFWFRHEAAAGKLVRRFLQDEATRADNRRRLQALAKRILAEIPGTALASDQLYREADLAIDFCEDVRPLPDQAVDRIVALFEAAGATAKVSSIHVNGWFGTYDKLTMTRIFVAECFACELDEVSGESVFLGDSPNDQPMFARFEQSIGVANVRRFLGRMAVHPRYVTERPGGFGFAEAAAALLAAR